MKAVFKRGFINLKELKEVINKYGTEDSPYGAKIWFDFTEFPEGDAKLGFYDKSSQEKLYFGKVLAPKKVNNNAPQDLW